MDSSLSKDKKLKKGFTTGSCAAAAAKAATFMLFSGVDKNEISIITPAGIVFNAQITDISRTKDTVSCAVIKDGGDDPDITTGAHITATVSIDENDKSGVLTDGGIGVGRVTKPGLDQPVGNAAINHVPREIIEKEVLEVCELFDFRGTVKVFISVPEGIELAKKTFNPRLGIEGGISILGTSGIVEPMSSQALLDTIQVELNQKHALGFNYAAVSPGNYGVDFMAETFGYDLDKSVKCSNFIGDTVDMVFASGFKGMLLTGHIGKLIKVSGGIMNTHSKYGDRRMELFSEAAAECGCSAQCCKNILEAVTTEEGIRILKEYNSPEMMDRVMNHIMDKILFHLRKRAKDTSNDSKTSLKRDADNRVECILYSSDYGILAQSDGAKEMLDILMNTEK